ncbi:hypothetical protein UlMin_033403 [Ulmus minor]
MGGIGKTTLARVLFNKFSHLFEGRCFLSNVREKSKNRDGFIVLKVELLSKLLNRNNLDPDSAFERNRVRRMKVLIVLDDVSHETQLNVLGGDRGDSFGPGSRVIVTTRDRRALIHQVNDVYKLDGLNRDDALGLFHWHAFKETSPTPDFNELSKEVVDYAGGNPLTLEISGSFFRGKEIEDWKSLLERLKGSSIEDEGSIQKILKISYDGLRKDEKDVFLDIACCFKTCAKDFVKGLLDVTIIKDLVDKSLIIDNGEEIYTHDLVQEMGCKVVRESSGGDLGKLSRIWNDEDAYSVLHNNIGTEKIEAISLDAYGESCCETQLNLPRDVFKKMYNLRLLLFGNNKVHLPEGLDCLPNKLKYLQWDYYPLKSLPKNFNPCNLVVLHMSYSDKLEQLWDGVKDLNSLREIDLSYCTNLTQLPDLSRASKLEYVSLDGCRSLKKLPQLPKTIKTFCNEFSFSSSLDSLSSLSVLQISECKRLESFPTKIYLESIKLMVLQGCPKLKIFPEIEKQMENLMELRLDRTAIKELPRSIENLVNLQKLSLYDCEEFKLLPNSIWKLYHLKALYIVNCSKLNIFPEIEEPMKNLMKLYLQRIAIKELPRPIENLGNLRDLFLNDCKELQLLPNTICKLYHLEDFSFVNCSKIPPSVGFLDAIGCISLEEVLEQHWFDQCIANCPVSDEQYRSGLMRGDAMMMCWAGHKIPRWFTQNKKSSLSMELCLDCFDNNFLDIAFGVVVDFNGSIPIGNSELCCQAHCDGAPDGVLFTWRYAYWGKEWEFHGDYVFIGCDKSSRANFMKKLKEYKANQNGGCTSISVNFNFSFETRFYKPLNLEVKNCGVYLLYANDVKIGEKGVDVDDDVVDAEKDGKILGCNGKILDYVYVHSFF